MGNFLRYLCVGLFSILEVQSKPHNANIISDEADAAKPGEPLTPEDFLAAKGLGSEFVSPQNATDVLLSAGEFEGDIKGVNIDKLNEIDSAKSPFKNVIRDMNARWPHGVVPYAISATYSSNERKIIARVFEEYHKRTCIKFVPRTYQNDYIYFYRGIGCSSVVGRQGGEQDISLGDGCLYIGVIIHELMHVLGFWHEQSRPDRDNHITVVWENILKGMEYNFKKYSWNEVQTLNVQYNTGSIMHYGPYTFSKDPSKPTIIAHDDDLNMGQRRYFSDEDLQKINKLYECVGGLSLHNSSAGLTLIEDSCQDGHVFCEYWAQSGECSRNPQYMKSVCRKSCKTCKRICKDENRHCQTWSKRGECTLNAAYMTLYCRKSCGMCNARTSKDSDCEDDNKYCAAWVKDNQCNINPEWMRGNCRKSCGVCR